MKISPQLRAWLVDAGERIGSTFLAAFLGSLGIEGITALAGGHVDTSALRVAEQAGAAAVFALVKALVAAKVNGTVSPASLAPEQQPGQALSDAPGAAVPTPRTLQHGGDGTGFPDMPLVGPPGPGSVSPAEGDGESVGSPPVLVRTIVLPERKVTGKPLGRHVHFDERSRAFAVTPQSTPLASVRHKRHARVFDQGQLGSCTGNACAGALSTAPFAHRFTERRAVAIYEAATRIDNVPGSYPPDDTGSDGLSVAKVAKSHGWCSSYLHCFSLDAVLTALQTGPVMLGVSWRSGFDTPTADGQMPAKGAVRGGHEIVADEIDVEHRRVWITNSWGTGWALSGRAWWSWDDLGKILADNGDATVLTP